MPDFTGTTRSQTLFLRAFRTNPAGPPPSDWPSPAILRKWLRKPAFLAALRTLQEALRFQTDFHLANAATQAARKLASDDAELTTQDLNRLLRHAHLRQRFAVTAPETPTQPNRKNHDDDEDHEDQEDHDDHDDAESCTHSSTLFEPIHCVVRRPVDGAPMWVGDRALLRELAYEEGYVPPLRDWPDFPKPVPQDTFYYRLLHNTSALLWYMQLYDSSGNDHRFSPILLHCKILVPNEAPPRDVLPHFKSDTSPGTT